VSEVHRASSSLQQLQRELLASNRAISASTKLANNLFRDTLTGSGQFSSHFVNLNSDVDKFGKNLDSGRLKLKNYFQTFREHATTQKGMIRELAKEQVMLQNSVLQPLGRNAQGLMQYNVMIPRGLDAVKNSAQLARMELQIMNRALSEGAGSLINWGKNTQWAGRQLTVGLTVPLTMFGAAAGKAFREADQELVRLTKVYGGLAATSAADLKAIREEVVQTAKSLSQTMGASFKDTIALGADIAATGKMGNELLGSIEETTRLAILGEVDRQDAMKATLSIQTAFKQNTQQLTESINFLNAVENQTSTTLNDLVEAIPKAGPVIQQLGGSIEDLALYMTAMREGGINASEGANALKSGLASLINPTKQTVGIMSDFGIDVMGMVAKNTGDTTGMLLDLQKALNTLDPLSKARALEQMFGKFQFARMSALLNNLGKEGSQTLQVMDLMKASTSDLAGIAERELGMITESASGKYRRAMESLKAQLADVGDEFLGVATKLINAASKILEFFTNLPSPIKKALTFMAGFTALVGPLIMLTGVLANFFGYITKGIVQLRSFFMKANGWKMLTPEIIAAQKAAEMVENAFYSDAAAAQVLHNALQKLVLDYQNLQAASMKNAVPVNAGVSTVAGNTIVAPAHGRRVVDPDDPYVGDPNTRAMSHIRPRDPNNPATLFGGVPGAIPVNRGISRTPQIYMHDRLPNVEGLTSVKGISTGIVAPEAAKFHALMATLGMQTEQEIAALKKTIAMGGTVSRELLDTFDDILPITQRFADSAATQSALIVQQMRNAEITVDQAKARILALNAQIEADMGSAVSMYAAGRGRTIDLTRAPMMDQPVVDANGQFTLRDLYKKKTNAAVMEEFGRVRGVRTFGAPYSIQTTRMPKFNIGGEVESFGPNKTVVSGPSSVNYDDRLGSVPLGGYVLNQQAAMDPANAPLVAMAPSTYLNDGGNITAALTPREVVFGPQIQRMPELYAAVDAANSGYSFGGQIMRGTYGYGRDSVLSIWAKLVNSKDYPTVIKAATVASDAAILSQLTGMDIKDATKRVSSDYDEAIEYAKKAANQNGTRKTDEFVKARTAQLIRLSKEFPGANLILDEYSSKNKYNQKAKASRMKAISPETYAGTMKAVINDLIKDGVLTQRQANKVFGILGDATDFYDPISKSHTITAKRTASIFNAGELQDLLVEGGMSKAEAAKFADVTGVRSNNFVGQSTGLAKSFNSMGNWLQRRTDGTFIDEVSPFQDEAKSNFISGIKKLKDKLGIKGPATMEEIIRQLTLQRIKSASGFNSKMITTVAGRLRHISFAKPALGPLAGSFNKGGMIPGGSISRGRSNYGNIAPALRLLAPDKQLKILAKARELSSRGSLGKFADMPVTEYGHQISASTGMSYPVPGVSGLYKVGNKKVFVKGVPNELTAVHEPIGTQITRDLFGIHSPVQTARTVANPVDPSKKTKLLALESDYDPRFANTNVPWDEDTILRQLANSLLLNNKDLSRANVYGNFNPDVGQAGVLPKASGNTRLATADEMNSMEKQALINLLAVKGGARKDFARDTAPIIAKMSPKKYGRRMKKILEDARPKLVKIINGLPEDLRPPYQAMLKRLDDGIEVDWSQYHAVHANPKYLNAGGPVGGGPIRRGRYAYGPKKDGSRRPGNPAKAAAWDAKQREQRERDLAAERSRAASHQIQGQQALTTGLGREAARTGTTSFYNPGSLIFPQIGAQIRASLSYMSNSVIKGSVRLNLELLAAANKTANVYNRASSIVTTFANKAQASISSIANSVTNFGASKINAIVRAQNAFAANNYPVGQAPAQGFFGPGMIGRYKDLGDGIQSRKVGVLGARRTEYLVDGVTMSAKQARQAGVSIPQRANGMSVGAQMGIGMAGSMGGMALMGKEKVNIFGKETSGMNAGMMLMGATSILPMLPYVKALTALKSGASSAKAAIMGVTGAGAKAAQVVAQIARFAKAFSLVGVVATAAFGIFKMYQNYKDAQQDATMGLSMTARAAEEAGVKYFNLKETMQGYIDKQKVAAAAAKSSEFNSIGMPGLPRSIEDLKKAKEEGKALKDLIESLNRADGKQEAQRIINNQKAQMVAAGMSIEEANKKIYGALANSNKASQSYQLLADVQFGSIVDKASAASFAVGNLVSVLNSTDASSTLVGSGFEGLINTFDEATKSLVGTKDALGNAIDDYEAYKLVMSSAEEQFPGFNEEIGSDAYDKLKESQSLLAGISNEADSIKSILAKWKLFTSGINLDLKNIDSTLAIKLAGFSEAIATGISDLTAAADNSTTYGATGAALKKMQGIISANSAASQRAAAAEQRSSQEQLKIISKKIKLIEDEKNAKLDSLRATQDASNYALELQKLQIQYADAVSRGDMAAANQAKLDIDQLTMNRQSDLAQKAIEDAAKKAKEPLEKQAQAIQDKSDKKQIAMANNQDNAALAGEITAAIQKLQTTYNDLTSRAITATFLPEKQRVAEEAQIQSELIAFLKEMQKAGTGSTLLAKTVRESFPGYFDKDGKPLSPGTTTGGSPTGFDSKGKPIFPKITIPNLDSLAQFAKDLKSVVTLAEDITGGMNIKELAKSIATSLHYYKTRENNIPGSGTATSIKAANIVAKDGNAAANQAMRMTDSQTKKFTLPSDPTRKYSVFTYNSKTYAVDPISGTVYNFDSSLDILGAPVKDRKKMATGGSVKHFNPGGNVSGPGTSTSDSIPAMLSDGEWVIKADSVKKAEKEFGPSFFSDLNAGRFANGGKVSKMGTADSMIKAAESMIGYQEGRGNDTIFGKFAQKAYDLQTRYIAWCGAFINWAAKKSGVDLASMIWTPGGAQSFMKSGKWTTMNPRRGDLAFMDFPGDGVNRISHVGLVSNVLGKNSVSTIEGNTSGSGSQRSGGAVLRKVRQYNLKNAPVVGFGRPSYKPVDNIKYGYGTQEYYSADDAKSDYENERYTVNRGDTLSSIASKYGITVNKLMEMNPQLKDPKYMGGSRIFAGTKVSIKKFAEGGKVVNSLTNSGNWISGPITVPRQKKPGVPYSRSGKPIGNPFGQYWGELSRFIGPRSPGMDIWGGTEIPGLKFTGKVPQHSDYMHQMLEQPRKPFASPGMGIDRDPMRYAGSGASMGGIGNGAYGLGPLMFHAGGPVGHTHSSAPHDLGMRSFGLSRKQTEAEKMRLQLTPLKSENQKQKARKNKNLSYYESKIDDPINNYSEGFGKVFTRSPFGLLAPLTSLASDLLGVYFQGKTPTFAKDGIGKALNPTSYESDVSSLMKAMIHPFGEIAKGSATKGDWANAGLNFVPGVGALKGVNTLRARSAAYNLINKATLDLPTEARVSLIPNATLRSNFVALKKADKVDTPEFAKARYELALSDAIRAARRNNFTSLPDLKNTTAANLIEENKNLPKIIEESIKVNGKDYIFRFEKADILPTDAKYIDKFIEGLKEGRVTSEGFGAGGMHQAEILDPVTKKQMSWINYDPVTGHISYRGTHPEYRWLHLSEALYNKAVSITRIKHSPTLTDMGRPSALRIGGFMADDPYYGATSITGIKSYLDTLMKLKKSKKAKPSTGEPRKGIGSWENNHITETVSSAPATPRYPIDEFNDRNSIIGWQFDRTADLDSALSAALRPETIRWFGSTYRTSANFPYGPGGYIEPAALPELQRIIEAEKLARQSEASRGSWGIIRGDGWANGGLVQNFSNSSLKNLGLPMFENGINMVPANMLAMLHKDEAVIPANMNPFNPNATAAASGSVYNINVELNGTNVTAKDVALEIRNEMRLKEMAAGVNRMVGKQ
jgi:TP901 family phage tail tape measure protein